MSNNNFILSIPTKIKEAIDNQFPRYTNTDLVKIYFLYYKINKEKTYQIHSKNHVWMLSLKNGAELKYMLDGLIALKLIIPTTVARIGFTSNTYKVNKPYDYKHESCFRINYYEGQTKFPIWVRKYVCDGGLVKGEEYSNFKKHNKNIENDLSKVVLDQQKTIKDMQLHIQSLEAELALLRTSKVKTESSTATVGNVPFKASNKAKLTDHSFTYVSGDNTYIISNYNKLVELSSTDIHLNLALKKIVMQTKQTDSIITNNKMICVSKVTNGNIINVQLA